MTKLFLALDEMDLDQAINMSSMLSPVVDGFKIGLEFFCAYGIEGYKAVAALGREMFLDLKLHDIPNTVANAVWCLLPLRPSLLTVHVGGGVDMMRRVKERAWEFSEKNNTNRTLIIGVTILTSFSTEGYNLLGFSKNLEEQALHFSNLAKQSLLDGVVCSPLELSMLKKQHPDHFIFVTPGIRLLGGERHDQSRVCTPEEAKKNGSDIVVVGRSISQSRDPLESAIRVSQALRQESGTTFHS